MQKAQVCKVQGETIRNGGSPRNIAAPVYSGQLPRQSRRVEFTADPRQGAADWFLQDVSTKGVVTHACHMYSFLHNNCYGQD